MSDEIKALSLNTPREELERQILQETDVDNLKNVVDLFNMNIKKKDIIRTGKLSDLQDKVFSQMEERLDKHAGEFSNKDLLDYYKAMQDSINKADTSLDNINVPAIQLNQNQVNINIGGEPELNRESRRKVADVVKLLLQQCDEEDTEINDAVEDDIVDADWKEDTIDEE